MRNAIPKRLLKQLRALIEDYKHEYSGILSKCKRGRKPKRVKAEPFNIGRLILDTSRKHKIKLQQNGELVQIRWQDSDRMAFKKRALAISKKYASAIQTAARNGGIQFKPPETIELVRSIPGAPSQHQHMDTYMERLVALAPINPSTNAPATEIAIYPKGYIGYPQNTAPDAIPLNWEDMQIEVIDWNVGDVLFLQSNLVHNAPENDSEYYRDLVIATAGSKSNEFTDDAVITNKYFNIHKNTLHKK
jgi:hypothetical protein